MTQQEQAALSVIQQGFQSRDDQIAKLQAALAKAQADLKAEQSAHATTKDGLRKIQEDRDGWQKKCETMGSHPDVRAAKLKEAEKMLAQAKANYDNLKPKE